MTADNDPAAPANPHRLDIELTGRGSGAYIDYKGVCDAPEGAPCRMWCEHPDCQEDTASDDHETHVLVDQGQCNPTTWLNCDPSLIPELYDGETTQLRPGPITLSQDCDGVNWSYSEPAPTLTTDERAELEEYHRRDAAGYVEYGIERNPKPPYDTTGLSFDAAIRLRDAAQKQGATATIIQRAHTAPSGWITTVRPACEENCRHRCPECRMGLVRHLTCDPQCGYHLPAADQ